MWCEHCGVGKVGVRVSMCPDNPRWTEVPRAFRDRVSALVEKNEGVEVLRARGRDCDNCDAPRTWSIELRFGGEP